MSLKIKNVAEKVTLDDGREVQIGVLSPFEVTEVISEIKNGRPHYEVMLGEFSCLVARVATKKSDIVPHEPHQRFKSVVTREFMNTLSLTEIIRISDVATDKKELEESLPNSAPTPPGSKE